MENVVLYRKYRPVAHKIAPQKPTVSDARFAHSFLHGKIPNLPDPICASDIYS